MKLDWTDTDGPFPRSAYTLADSTHVQISGLNYVARSGNHCFVIVNPLDEGQYAVAIRPVVTSGHYPHPGEHPDWVDAADRAARGDMVASSALIDYLIDFAGEWWPAGNTISPAKARWIQAKQERIL